jgi:hypothetical protein
MRNLLIATSISIVMGMAGALVWNADAAGVAGAVPHGLSGPMSTPLHPAACNGVTGAHGCGPGFTWRCNGYGRCWCGPC